MGKHREWRAQAKKMRRKRIRQKTAQERDDKLKKEQDLVESSPRYQAWLSEQRALELFAEEEEALQAAERNKLWLAEETRAQKAWQERQERLASARAERVKQEMRIREEWEEEQQKLKAAKEDQDRIAEEKQQKQDEVMRHIQDIINKGGDMPPEVNIASATNPDRPPCPFFTKTGACRFGDRCSRNHTRPGISRVLLIPNFYDHIGLRQLNPEEPEAADDWLEYEDSETYQHFLEFYEDVLPEWEQVGPVSQFKVCCNFESHLKGNVYVEYEKAHDAVKAFKLFHGRWYGGKQINVEFVKIESWKAAICGQFHKNCCPKGRLCNFLHVFRNPRNAFCSADFDRQAWRRKPRRSHSRTPESYSRSWSHSPENSGSRRKRECRWSASPTPPRENDVEKSSRSSSSRSHHSYSHAVRQKSSSKSSRKVRESHTNRTLKRDRSRERNSDEHRSRRSNLRDGAEGTRGHSVDSRSNSSSCKYSHRKLHKRSDFPPGPSSRQSKVDYCNGSADSDSSDRKGIAASSNANESLNFESDKCVFPASSNGGSTPTVVHDIQSEGSVTRSIHVKYTTEELLGKQRKTKRKREKKSSHRKEKKRKRRVSPESNSSASSSLSKSGVSDSDG